MGGGLKAVIRTQAQKLLKKLLTSRIENVELTLKTQKKGEAMK
jgi:hypothetical protein